MKGHVDSSDYQRDKSTSQSSSRFVGNVTEERINGRSILEVRNKILAGETLEVLSPDGSLSMITLSDPLKTTEGIPAAYVNNSQFIQLDQDLVPFTILRRVEASEFSGI